MTPQRLLKIITDFDYIYIMYSSLCIKAPEKLRTNNPILWNPVDQRVAIYYYCLLKVPITDITKPPATFIAFPRNDCTICMQHIIERNRKNNCQPSK